MKNFIKLLLVVTSFVFIFAMSLDQEKIIKQLEVFFGDEIRPKILFWLIIVIFIVFMIVMLQKLLSNIFMFYNKKHEHKEFISRSRVHVPK